jgi:hypothetical protein
MEGKPRRERERAYQGEEDQIPHLELSFPQRRIRIATRGKPGTETPSRERETYWKNCSGERGF